MDSTKRATLDPSATAAPANTVHSGDEGWRLNLGRTRMRLQGARPATWWTGLAPQDPRLTGRDARGHLHGTTQINLATASRADVQAYFDNGWTLTEVFFAALQSEEAFYRPPYHALRHPLIFYYVHPAALYVNKLVVAGLLPAGLNADFEVLFETGVDEMRWDDMAKNSMRWPTIEAAHAYRAQVYQTVSQLIATHPGLADGHDAVTAEHPLWALFMGFEHERIHLETSSVLIRELPLNLVQRPAAMPPLHTSARLPSIATAPAASPSVALVDLPASQVRIGKAADEPYFGWDNEYGERLTKVAAFAAAKNLITNGEFHAFVAAGGYREEAWWSPEGWRWRTFRNAKAPTFWRQDGPQGSLRFKLRTICEEVPMRWDWPAIVNVHEADAYAQWFTAQHAAATGAGDTHHFRLPTEAEHHVLRQRQARQDGHGQATDDGNRTETVPTPEACAASDANRLLRWSSESPVAAAAGAIGDLYGNVWQWTSDDFHALPGFRVHSFYEDFSTPCFDGEHRMILGGSFASLGDEASPWARFHFRPHFFQHAGFRLVYTQRDNDGAAALINRQEADLNPYETQSLLGEYMLLHYGEAADVMPYAFGPTAALRFPQRCAELALSWAERAGLQVRRALDLGCAVGGATFGLAAGASEGALGIDLSDNFIQAAQTLQQTGELAYFRKDEGELGAWLKARVPSGPGRERAAFRRGDACALPPDLGSFDIVLLANLLCRVPSPRSVLRRMGGPRGLVRPGGLLVMTTPFTWSEAYTPKEAWIGGKNVHGVDQWSETELLALLDSDFELLERTELPLVIREHRRKFQYIVPGTFVLRRRP